jgi:ABC-type Fe3+/spermidine/putrescine transport system ATPase subunit
MSALLTARNLSHAYGPTRVFDGVDVTISAGERLAVLGASGSGKTTLLRLFAGLESPSGGTLDRAPNLAIGMVFQDLALWPNLTALENVMMAVHALARRERHQAALCALQDSRVAEHASRLPSQLSVGQQQRVALARAIAAKPALLLLDEPFSSLDLVLKHELFETIRHLAVGRALVLVTHDPLEAMALCETVLVLQDGHAVESGRLRDVLVNPRAELLRVFQEQTGQKRDPRRA